MRPVPLLPTVDRVRARLRTSFPGRCMRRMFEIDGRNRAITIAGQAFIALIPLLIVLAGWTSSSDRNTGKTVINYFSLSGSTADAVESLFAAPPSATGGFTILGFAILVFSVGSFARSIQRTYEAAWRIDKRGFRGTADGLAGAGTLLISLGGLAWLGQALTVGPISWLATLPLQFLLAVPLWVLFIRLALSRRASARRVLPSALVSAVGQVALSWGTQIYVPHLIEVDAQRYGVIGVAFAIVSWLVIVSYLLVGSAVVGAELTDTIAKSRDARSGAG